jgi:hypothetical protein
MQSLTPRPEPSTITCGSTPVLFSRKPDALVGAEMRCEVSRRTVQAKLDKSPRDAALRDTARGCVRRWQFERHVAVATRVHRASMTSRPRSRIRGVRDLIRKIGVRSSSASRSGATGCGRCTAAACGVLPIGWVIVDLELANPERVTFQVPGSEP